MELGISNLGFIIELGQSNKYKDVLNLLFDSTEACLNAAELNNIKVVELIIDPPKILSDERKGEFIALLNQYKIKKQIHGPFIDINLCSHNDIIVNASVKSYNEIAKICNEINIKMMTIHPGLANFMIPSIREYNKIQLKKALNQLLNFASSYNLMICLENMPKKASIMLDTANIEEIFSIINRNDLYMTYDTSHFYTNDGNIALLWKKFHKKIKNIHLVDNFSKDSDTHPPLGTGKINFNRIFEIIKSYNYKGPLIIEISSFKYQQESINFINKYF
ncbi:MAG: sugar phosphate isomerase/epimerase family protein [Candidatus Hermodarchaeota archaeon]